MERWVLGVGPAMRVVACFRSSVFALRCVALRWWREGDWGCGYGNGNGDGGGHGWDGIGCDGMGFTTYNDMHACASLRGLLARVLGRSTRLDMTCLGSIGSAPGSQIDR